MMKTRGLLTLIGFTLMMWTSVMAHEITVQGTVVAIEKTRIQVRTGDEKPGAAAAWYAIDAKTKIRRGKTTVSYVNAHITKGERIVLIIDHGDNGKMMTKEIRLADR